MRLIDGLILLSGLIAAGTATIESVAGPIIGYASAAYVAWQLHGIYQEISFVYGTAEDAIKLIKGSIDATSSMLQTGVMPNLQKYHHPADD